MPNKFASGKYAIAECDRCDQRYMLKDLRIQTLKTKPYKVKVCKTCWDPDHPQLQLGMYPVNDPQAVREPRPDVSYYASGTTGLYTSQTASNSTNNAGYPSDGSRQIQWGWNPVGGASFFDTVLTPNDLISIGQTGTVSFDYAPPYIPPATLPPTVTSASSSTTSTSGGASIIIYGTNFGGTTTVTVGGTSATFTVLSATSIGITTPAHSAGAVNVVVTNLVGSGTGVNLITYAVYPPTVLSITPNNGDVAGGTSVTIGGTNFTGATSVTIGGTSATFSVLNSTTITATTPSSASIGAVNVTVTTAGGTGTGTNLFTYTGVLPTTITLTPGTTSWTVPADWSSTNMIELWGGGGGGGNGGSVSSLAGSGGGGGGYARIVNTTSLTPGQVVTVAVGTGGAYGPTGIIAAQAGGTTIFGSVSATGGSGGTTQYASSGGSVSGGSGVGGDVNYTGGSGGGQTFSVNTAPGGAGGGDSIGGAGGGGMGSSNPNYPTVSGGAGAAGFGGAGGARGVSAGSPNGFPGASNAKGGGGGGSLYDTTGVAGAGGYPGGGGGGTFGGTSANGADGVIKITYTPI